ncbi:MAG: diguanylate cyclase, partial [Eubacteriales bacterium]|nr:diguanylate cyclase [Eubacteriales bacterium]
MNKRYWEIMNRTPVAYTGTSALAAIHPDDREAVLNELADAIKSERNAACNARVRYGDNGYSQFHIVGRIICNASGKYAVYASFTNTLEEPMSMQEMLSVAFAAVMDSSSDMAFVKDKNLRYVCCSRVFAQLVGVNGNREIVGKTDFDLFSKAFAEQYVADDRKLMESGKSIVDIIEPIPSEDGRPRYANTSKYLLYDSNGNVAGVYGVGRDVTQAREAEARHAFLLNNIPGGVAIGECIWNAEKHVVILTYFSDGFCRLFGFTRDEYEVRAKTNMLDRMEGEHISELTAQMDELVQNGTPIDLVYRMRTKDNEQRWLHIKAVLSDRSGERLTVNAVLFDVTERQQALELLRISEEESRLAIQHSKTVVCRLNIAARRLTVPSGVDSIFEVPSIVEDVPYGSVQAGRVSPETADAYIALYESIFRGEQGCTLTYQLKSSLGWRWIEARASTIFSNDGKPVSAVISQVDATESFEKDTAYKKWLQTLRNKDPKAYTLYRCKISERTAIDAAEGSLLSIRFKPEPFLFHERTAEYANRFVLPEDVERYCAFLQVDALLDRYRSGERNAAIEYREKLKKDGYRWLRLTVDMVEYPHSSDVEAHLLYEDIDAAKRAALLTIERAEMDALTGVYNRSTFEDKVNALIRTASPNAKHALLMLDIDGFKLVNDVFGHGTGDQTLIDLANLLRTVLRHDDLLGRLGGDEFLVFLNNISAEAVASSKAKQICELARKTFNAEVQISGSVGIAVCPQDGTDFETLYRKADETLYHVKDSGRDNYAFYQEDIKEGTARTGAQEAALRLDARNGKKRRILIVDDNKLDYEMMANMLRSECIIEKAKDGNAALIRLRHYGGAISAVLLDLMMPGMDGFAVLEKMQQSVEMRAIPVIVVSGDESRETSLRAIRAGATDFVTKPIDPDVLRIRIQSAISKAENERLRVKNSFLELQNDETVRYRMVLDRIGLTLAELDWATGRFTYGPSMPQHLAGRYNTRTLWHIFLSDHVADAQTVKSLQQLVHGVAEDRTRSEGSIT